MKPSRLLALDLGTTGVRALLVEEDGRVSARTYRPLHSRYPRPGWVEQDPEEMWEQSRAVLAEALGAVEPRSVAALGVVAQRGTAVAWDAESGRALCPAIGWQDRRTAARVAVFRAQGIPLTTLASATKFEWWLREEPAVQAAARSGRLRLGNVDAWLSWQLSGGSVHVTDPGHASTTALFDLRQGDWHEAALALFGLERSQLPRVVATAGVAGATPAALLGAALPLAARAGDQQAATFAQGVHNAGEAKLTLGTSAMLDLHTGRSPAPLGRGVFPLALWRLPDGDHFCVEANVFTAGAVFDWLVSVGLLAEPAALDRVAGEVQSTQGVTFVPSLQGLGSPWLDESARGLLGGLTRGTTAAHVVRAALEGVAQRCADLCDAVGLEPGRALRVDGGLARSELLLRRIADLCGRSVERAAETEATALGGALLAGLGVGLYPDAGACTARVAAPARFDALQGEASRARERARWRSLVERAREPSPEAMR